MMKNDLKKSLNRELQGVHVSSRLRARILIEARERRFRARKRAMAMRTLASAAAILLVFAIFSGVIFLRQRRPATPDTVLSQGQGGRVWADGGDIHYHARRDCGGIHREKVLSLAEAKAAGLTACPECIRSAAPTPAATVEPTPAPTLAPTAESTILFTAAPTEQAFEAEEMPLDEPLTVNSAVATVDGAAVYDTDYAMVWTSEDDEFYHISQDCSPGADEFLPETECAAMGKEACRKCFSSPDVWMTPGGTYFHEARNCSGMENAQVYLRSYAVQVGKKVCPLCLEQRPVWIERNGKIYHASRDCIKTDNVREISEWEAIMSGLTVCDQCFSEFWDIAESPSAEVQVTVAGSVLAVQLTGDCHTEYIQQGNSKYHFRDRETNLPFFYDSFWTQDAVLSKLLNDEICGLYTIGYSLTGVLAENDGKQHDLSEAAMFPAFYGDTIRCLYLFPLEKTPDRLLISLSASACMETVDVNGTPHSSSAKLSMDGADIAVSGRCGSSKVMPSDNPLIICSDPLSSSDLYSAARVEEAFLTASRALLDEYQFVSFNLDSSDGDLRDELADTVQFYDADGSLLSTQDGEAYNSGLVICLLPETEGDLTAVFTQRGEPFSVTLK